MVTQQSITISAVVHIFQQTKEEDGNIHKRGRRKYSQKYGYERCRRGELAELACNKAA